MVGCRPQEEGSIWLFYKLYTLRNKQVPSNLFIRRDDFVHHAALPGHPGSRLFRQ